MNYYSVNPLDLKRKTLRVDIALMEAQGDHDQEIEMIAKMTEVQEAQEEIDQDLLMNPPRSMVQNEKARLPILMYFQHLAKSYHQSLGLVQTSTQP